MGAEGEGAEVLKASEGKSKEKKNEKAKEKKIATERELIKRVRKG